LFNSVALNVSKVSERHFPNLKPSPSDFAAASQTTHPEELENRAIGNTTHFV
jgi:hypothetical protein